jgi:hypothetical protein
MVEIEEGKTKGRKDILYLSHIIIECNISTKTSLTLKAQKQKLGETNLKVEK